jgi:Ca-activated chloride channel family protein
MKKRALIALFSFVMLLAASAPAAAQDPRPPMTPPIEPTLLPPVWDFSGLRIAYQRVSVTLEDQVATTHIDQLFVNDNDWMLEGTYLFPLPSGAAVSQLTMWVNGEPIEAKVLAADEARSIYDEIVRQLRDPALLEYVGSSAIQANVFPIPAHDERRIEIEYSQVLAAENGVVHYVYPQSTDLYTNTTLDSQSIRVELASAEAIRTVYSPTHPVAISRPDDFHATVGFEDSNVLADQDFELYYSVSPEEIGLSLLSFQEGDEDGFFLLLAAPTVEVDPDQVVARDIILVLDTSGSMEGEKLAQAKEAAAYVLRHLNPEDRFNVVAFSTGVELLAPELVAAGDPDQALRFIDRLEALGGTNISEALLAAVRQTSQERPTTVLFLTDGLATEGITDTGLLLEAVAQQTPDSVRLFAFGVGNDVDTTLLDSLAQDHGGASSYVRPGQAIDETVSAFYAKVSTPVLSDIALDFGEVEVSQLYPASLPDLFAGGQLVVAGRYRQGGPAVISLTGQVNGQERRFTYPDNRFAEGGGEAFIPRLWATRAIGHLLTEIRLGGENPELVDSVVSLSIRYGIITPYTSYLIEEKDIFTQTGLQTAMEEAMRGMPAGVEVSGEAAVQSAADQGSMSAAEAPAPMPTVIASDGAGMPAGQLMRAVGNKTFVYRDGMWVDTNYRADEQVPEQIGFASQAYFDLLAATPELGDYLALGREVLVVYQGTAYQVVSGEDQSQVTLPVVESAGPTPQPDPDGSPAANPSDGGTQASGNGLCASALLAPLFIGGLAAVAGHRRRIGRR